MDKVNSKFIEEMQKRLNEKGKIYIGKLNYKNMDIHLLRRKLKESYNDYIGAIIGGYPKIYSKKLVDIANFCWMLWERKEEE